jgi:hypothetical protein
VCTRVHVRVGGGMGGRTIGAVSEAVRGEEEWSRLRQCRLGAIKICGATGRGRRTAVAARQRMAAEKRKPHSRASWRWLGSELAWLGHWP